MEYNGKREYLYLAEETRSIDKALARLGAKDYSDCKLQICDFNIESKIWLERSLFSIVLNRIYAVNEVVKAIYYAVDYEDVGKYAAENIRDADLPIELTDYIQSISDRWQSLCSL